MICEPPAMYSLRHKRFRSAAGSQANVGASPWPVITQQVLQAEQDFNPTPSLCACYLGEKPPLPGANGSLVHWHLCSQDLVSLHIPRSNAWPVQGNSNSLKGFLLHFLMNLGPVGGTGVQGSYLPWCLAAAGAAPDESPRAAPIDSPPLLAFGSFIFPNPARQEGTHQAPTE